MIVGPGKIARGVRRRVAYPIAQPGVIPRGALKSHPIHSLRVVWTGEKRPPKKGEWFLSGSIIEAYCALNDLTMNYPIGRHVKAKQVTTWVDLETGETIARSE